MSAKRAFDEEEDDEEDFDVPEEDYEDEEDDFIPGMDDGDDELEEEEEDEETDDAVDNPTVKGTLRLDEQDKLQFQGDAVQLRATEALNANILLHTTSSSSTNQQPTNRYETIMVGNLNPQPVVSSTRQKQPPRRFHVTFTQESPPPPPSMGKSDPNDQETKKPSARPFIYWTVYGCEKTTSSNNPTPPMEFRGGFAPSSSESQSFVELTVQVRTMATTRATAAAALPNDDDHHEADEEGIDYNELIALHQDAGLDLSTIKRRYQEQQQGSNHPTAEEPPTKREKAPPSDDDDDDIEF